MEPTNTAAAARTSRTVAARKAAAEAAADKVIAQLGEGATIVRLFERVWAKVQAFARIDEIELPDVFIVTGSGISAKSVTLAHVRFGGWALGTIGAPVTGEGASIAANVDPTGSMHELFVSGETMSLGAVRALTSVLHEATHLACRLLEITETSGERGRYHNWTFVEQARRFGLDWQKDADGAWLAPHKTIGYSAVRMTELGELAWAEELALIAAECRASCPVALVENVNPADPTDDRVRPVPALRPTSTKRRRVLFSCGCRSVAMFAEDAGDLTCGRCGGDFV